MPLRVVEVHQSILRKNSTLAQDLRARFERNGTYVINLLSSPGAGKTTLLEETLRRLGDRYRVGALVGDQATDRDAQRLRRSGAPVEQIVTGAECRLDAQMVTAALRDFDAEGLELLAIENVGNLICPAEYDLGEDLRIVVFSTTEGEDKPLKYPLAFSTAHVAVVSKIDLSDAAGFDLQAAKANVDRVHPGIEIVELSALRGDGMDEWIECLDRHIAGKRVLV